MIQRRIRSHRAIRISRVLLEIVSPITRLGVGHASSLTFAMEAEMAGMAEVGEAAAVGIQRIVL